MTELPSPYLVTGQIVVNKLTWHTVCIKNRIGSSIENSSTHVRNQPAIEEHDGVRMERSRVLIGREGMCHCVKKVVDKAGQIADQE